MLFRKISLKTSQRSGFALIATISILVLLALISVGLLSLSSVTVRSASVSASQKIARANAKMALMNALGELQKYAGPDQRVTASSRLTGSNLNQQNWTGVWSTQDDDALPVWLVSGNEKVDVGDLDKLKNYPADYVKPDNPGTDTFTLMSAVANAAAVNVPLVDVKDDNKMTGRYAFWVSDEGTKARVNLEGADQVPSSNKDRLVQSLIPAESNLSQVGPEFASLDPQSSSVDKESIVSMDTMDLALDSLNVGREYAHHLTVGGYGLPTNVVQGGMKADLSILFDQSQQGNSKMLEFYFGAAPAKKGLARNLNIYEFDKIANSEAFYLASGLKEGGPDVGPNWGNLYNYGRLWETLSGNVANTIGMDPPVVSAIRHTDWAPYNQVHIDNHNFKKDEQHTNSALAPVLSLLQVTFRLGVKDGTYPIPGSVPVAMGHWMQLHIKPVIGLWNPYNVKIKAQEKDMMWGLFPFVRVAATTPPVPRQTGGPYVKKKEIRANFYLREKWLLGQGGKITDKGGGPRLQMVTEEVDFEPGEFRLFSVSGEPDLKSRGNLLSSGLNEEGAFVLDLIHGEIAPHKNNAGEITVNPGEPMVLPRGSDVWWGGIELDDTLRGGLLNDPSQSDLVPGISSTYFSLGGGGGQVQYATHRIADFWTNSARQERKFKVPETIVSRWGQEEISLKRPIDELVAGDIRHIATWRFHLRTAQEAVGKVDESGKEMGSQRTRAWVDANPRFGPMNPAWDGSKVEDESHDGLHFISPFIGGRTSVPMNDGGPRGRGKVAEGQDSTLAYPEVEAKDDRVVHFGGYTSAFRGGKSQVALFDVPRSPLVSLGQFQHAQLARYGFEPAFPFGNSHANVRIPLGQTKVNDFNGIDGFRLVDISHEVNEQLWDEYFFSTIGLDYLGSYRGGLNENFSAQDLASGKKSLSNPRYRYVPLFAGEKIGEVVGREDLRGAEALASRIAIDGAFNVNSTSEEAWKSILSSMGSFQLPTLTRDGVSVEWKDAEGYRFPRFGHVIQSERDPSNATKGWVPGSSASSDSYWTGYREITDQELDSLARAIVSEVESRGPFRSFADFVNRDPNSSEKEHQRRGALQAALDETINSVAGVGNDAEAPSGGGFSTDAVGGDEKTSAGFSGYMMQGDVLQSLAPLLTVRSDYFRIRAVGQATDSQGNVQATAICEAFVQRTAEYVDGADEPHKEQDELVSSVNEEFGRRFRIVSFRWLKSV